LVTRVIQTFRLTDNWLSLYGDGALVSLRVRYAIANQHWKDIEKWVQKLSPEASNDPRWQYWHCRALQQHVKKRAAKREFSKAAERRTFWAFLAADHIQAPYAINNDAPPKTQITRLAALPRIYWLQAINEHGLVRNEWLHWLRQHPDESAALANYALAENWPALAVDAAIQRKDRNTLAWRFPLAHHQDFIRAAREEKMDP